MNAEVLAKYFKEPDTVGADGVKELEELCRDFPFFALPHLVLAKVFKLQNHYRYADLLKTAALMAPSREWLYDYLEGEGEVPEMIVESEVLESIVEPETELAIENEAEVNLNDKGIESIKESNIDLQVMASDIPETIVANPTTEDETAEEVEEVKEIQQKFVETEESLIEQVPQNIEIIAETKMSAPEEPEVSLPRFDTIPEYHIEDFYNWSGDDASENAKSFFDWLKNPVHADVTEEKTEQIVPEKTIKHADPMQLIEKFLMERPSISRPKAEFFNPANVAKKAEELHPDLVTETLANLFYKQGSLEKALYAYDILCLKIPEKRHYFAALIQKIKEEQLK